MPDIGTNVVGWITSLSSLGQPGVCLRCAEGGTPPAVLGMTREHKRRERFNRVMAYPPGQERLRFEFRETFPEYFPAENEEVTL